MTQPNTWTFVRDGIPEEVPLERWIWGVSYNDGSELVQFDRNGVFHQIGEVDQSRVRTFVLGHPDGSRRIDIHVPEGAKLIHGYKVIGLVSDDGQFQSKIYRFGYKHEGHTHLNYVMPDDTIIQATRELNAQELGFINQPNNIWPGHTQ